DLLIYRAKTKSVERFPTDGFWLGITDDIEPVTIESAVALERGDVALFHIDGVTEARNRDGEYFDIDRLADELRRLHHELAAKIVSRIADTAWSWVGTSIDDVSLLAVKRSESEW